MNKRLYKKSIFEKRGLKALTFLLFLLSYCSSVNAQESVARQWSELMLTSIRNDFARPTVHSRNLFHVSVGMYDAWAAYDSIAKPYMLGDSVGGLVCPFTGIPTPSNIDSARNEAISFAAYRLLTHRFRNSPGASIVLPLFDTLMVSLEYDTTNNNTDYTTGGPAALGNYIAQHIITFGLQDGSNEQNGYINQYYNPVNASLAPALPGNPNISDPDRWQPLSLQVFIDQSGNTIPINTPEFLGPEWGAVTPFSLNDSVRNVYTRDGDDYVVYHNPNLPPYLDTINASSLIEEYQWGFSLVSVWSSHLDSSSNVLWDISPASIGNIQSYPTNVPDLQNFYNLTDGGDIGTGHSVNPSTSLPYTPQIVPRSDYARVLAEFWADGPDSETPPGHWFELLNYVNDHPSFEKKWKGEGAILDDLEWDVKAYFLMGGTVHDAAVTAWGIKGWYDYIRPISAIRHMADNGQSSTTSLPNYAKDGIPLIPGYIEVVIPSDTLQPAFEASDTGKIKVLAWRGPDYIADPENDVAGVGWILAENWWPYQRPTFITPPFAGYVSGHSTFSRAAAEVMTAMTGDAFFPGGMGEFVAKKDSFLVFEDGPSEDITLQWATYRDASDQCSLSRIWGGIHPPVDDIPGRLIGEKIGVRAFDFAEKYMDAKPPNVVSLFASIDTISPIDVGLSTFVLTAVFDEAMDTTIAPTFTFPNENPLNTLTLNLAASSWLNDTTFLNTYNVVNASELVENIDVTVDGAADRIGNPQVLYQGLDHFNIDSKAPNVLQLSVSVDTISLIDMGVSNFVLTAEYDEAMDTLITPIFTFPNEDPLNTITLNISASSWLNTTTFLATYNVISSSEFIENIDVTVNSGSDRIGNPQLLFQELDRFNIDTKAPTVMQLSASLDTISLVDVGVSTFVLTTMFDEAMDTLVTPTISFPNENPLNTIALNIAASSWLNTTTFLATYNVISSSEFIENIDVTVNGGSDRIGNPQLLFQESDGFNIDTKIPNVQQLSTSVDTISLIDIGISNFVVTATFDEAMDTMVTPAITFPNEDPLNTIALNTTTSSWLNTNTFRATYNVNNSSELVDDIDITINGAADRIGNPQQLFQELDRFNIDTKVPNVVQLSISIDTISLIDVGVSNFVLTVEFNEAMDTLISPVFTFPNEDPLSTIGLNISASNWLNETTFLAIYNVYNSSEFIENIDVTISGATDRIGNSQAFFLELDGFNIDTKAPNVVQLYTNIDTITLSDAGMANFSITVVYDKKMNNSSIPVISFPIEDPLLNTLTSNSAASEWLDDKTYISWFDVSDHPESLLNIDVQAKNAKDIIGNPQNTIISTNLFNINTKQPELLTIIPSVDTISYSDTGVSTFFLALYFDELMDTTGTPSITFPTDNPLSQTLVLNGASSLWTNQTSYIAVYDVLPAADTLFQIDVNVASVTDFAGNDIFTSTQTNVFYINKRAKSSIPVGSSQYFGISIYPNPILEDGNFSIAFEKNMPTLTTTITDIRGKIIQSQIYNDSQLLNLTLEGAAGVYILIIESGNKKAAIKLVKK